jgi:hypothetical protein
MTVCLEKPRSWKDALKLRAAEMMGAMKAMQKARFSLPSICENLNNQFALIAKSWRREVKGNTLEVGAVLCGSRVWGLGSRVEGQGLGFRSNEML